MFPDESRKLLEILEVSQVSGNVAALQMNAHTLKGMCGMFEAKEAAAAALKIEMEAYEGRLGTQQQLEFLKTELSRAVDAVARLEIHQ